MRIILKLQNMIGNILFFKDMHISVILPKIGKSYGQSLRTSGTTLEKKCINNLLKVLLYVQNELA